MCFSQIPEIIFSHFFSRFQLRFFFLAEILWRCKIIGTMWVQLLLQFYVDGFETVQVFLSLSEDVHMLFSTDMTLSDESLPAISLVPIRNNTQSNLSNFTSLYNSLITFFFLFLSFFSDMACTTTLFYSINKLSDRVAYFCVFLNLQTI